MAAIVGKAMNIKSVSLDVTLDNSKDFKEYWTEMFHIRGNPWVFKFKKIVLEEDDLKGSYLAGFFYSKIDTPLKDWAIVAHYSMKIYSNKYNGKSFVYELEPHYYFRPEGWGDDSLIKWDELLDPDQ